MKIPLNGDDVLTFDFGVPYRKTFEEIYLGDQVDYSVLPLNFERYRPQDQARIAGRMLNVLEAHRDGKDLESGPFSVIPISLDEALVNIASLR